MTRNGSCGCDTKTCDMGVILVNLIGGKRYVEKDVRDVLLQEGLA